MDSQVLILDIEAHEDGDEITITAQAPWVLLPKLDPKDRLGVRLLPVEEWDTPAILTVTGNLSAVTHHFDAAHFDQHGSRQDEQGQFGLGCDCTPREMTREELLAFAADLVRERYPEPRPKGRSLLS